MVSTAALSNDRTSPFGGENRGENRGSNPSPAAHREKPGPGLWERALRLIDLMLECAEEDDMPETSARLAMVWEALQEMHLSRVLENMDEVVGERFGLEPTHAVHLGHWLAQAVTLWHSDLSGDEAIETLNTLAGQAVHGRKTAISFAWAHADWWMRYQRVIPPMMG
jgi:hypothetical protein